MTNVSSRRKESRGRPLVGALALGGIFGLFGKKGGAPKRTHLEVRAEAAPTAPPAVADVAPRSLMDDLRFKAFHKNVDPTPNARMQEMTCPSCDRNFRYFVNSNGIKTTCRCPGCGRQYRV